MRNKDDIRADQMEALPHSVKLTYSRAFAGSKARAIVAKCLECCCNDRDEVRNCQVYTCPLYEVRPYQRKGGE